MKWLLVVCAIALAPSVSYAQRYDSGWKIVDADQLSDQTFSGGGVRVNNLVITHQRGDAASQLAQYTLTITALKREPGKRDVRVELVGFKADKTPTIVSIVVVNFYGDDANKLQTGSHQFVALEKEVADTTTYVVRVLIP